MSIMTHGPAPIHPVRKYRRKRRRNPRTTWPSWTDQRWTVAEEPRPTFEPERPSQSDEDGASAFNLGYNLDLAAVPPAEWPELRKLAWWVHRNRGWLAREADDRRIDRLEARHHEPYEALHPQCVAEAGCSTGHPSIED